MPARFPGLRQHLPSLLVGIIVLLGIWARTRLPVQPFSDHDTWGFLYPSLSRLSGGVFCHSGGREFPYPFFINCVLGLFHSFSALAIIQHTLGMIAGILVWLTWRETAPFFPEESRTLHRWLGVAIAASYLLSLGPIRMEHSIRPEAIFPTVAAVALYCATRFSVLFFLEKRPAASLPWGIGLGTAALSLLFIKGAFGLGTLAALAPLIVALLRRNVSWKFRVAAATMPILLVGSLLWYPEHRLIRKFDPLGNTFAEQHLFAFQAPAIRKDIGDELSGRRPAAYNRHVLEKVAEQIDKVLRTPSPHFPRLGFDADAIIYDPDSVVYYLTEHFKTSQQLRGFYMHYYWGAWRHYPLDMSAKVGRQLVTFYGEKTPFDVEKKPISIAWEANHGTEMMPPLGKPLPIFDQYLAGQYGLVHSSQQWAQSYVIVLLNRFFAVASRLCTLGAVVGLGYLLWQRGGGEESTVWKRPTVWFLYMMSYGFFNTLTLAIGHTLEVRRYVQVQLSYTLIATGCGLLLLHLIVVRGIRARKARKELARQG